MSGKDNLVAAGIRACPRQTLAPPAGQLRHAEDGGVGVFQVPLHSGAGVM
jgi:hypothetical protein